MNIGENKDKIIDEDGSIIAYKAKRQGFQGEHWFVPLDLDEPLSSVVSNAIFSLDGVPEAHRLLDRIQLILKESAG